MLRSARLFRRRRRILRMSSSIASTLRGTCLTEGLSPPCMAQLTRRLHGRCPQEERTAALATAQAAQSEAECQLAAARQAHADALAAEAAVEARAAEMERAVRAAERRAAAAEAEREALQREHQDRQKRCVTTSMSCSLSCLSLCLLQTAIDRPVIHIVLCDQERPPHSPSCYTAFLQVQGRVLAC